MTHIFSANDQTGMFCGAESSDNVELSHLDAWPSEKNRRRVWPSLCAECAVVARRRRGADN